MQALLAPIPHAGNFNVVDDVHENDPLRFTVIQDDSSSIVSAEKAIVQAQPLMAEAINDRVAAPAGRVPTTVDEALRLAIKLAVDAGEYDRVLALTNILRDARLGQAVVEATRQSLTSSPPVLNEPIEPTTVN